MTGQKKKSLTSRFAAASLALALMQGGAVFAADGDVQAGKNPDPVNTPIVQNTQTVSGSGQSVQLNPLVHPAIILGGGAGLALLIFACAGGNRTRGTALRAASVLAFSGLLLNPELIEENRERLPTEVAVVVDKSASQNLSGRDKATEEAYQKVLEQLAGLEGVKVRTIEVGTNADGQGHKGTQLFSSLDSGLSDIPRDRLGGVIVITDGQIHDAPQSVKGRIGDDVPLHVMVTGHDQERDRSIVVEEAPQFGIVGQKQKIIFRVSDTGTDKTEDTVRVTLHDGTDIVGTKIVTPGETAEMEVDISHIGKNTFELTAEPLSGEITDVNNRVVVSANGVWESLSVLLITNQPYMGTRALRAIIKADPDIDAVDYKILQTPEKLDYTPLRDKALTSFPTHELFHNKLDLFDLVIIDNYQYSAMLPQAYFNKIANYTKEGGSLLVISGDEYAGGRSIYNTLMKSVLPASPTGQVSNVPYKPEISDQGQRHPVTRGLGAEKYGMDGQKPSWGNWSFIADSKAETGHVVMENDAGKPLLVLDRKEKGRVAMLQSNNSWLWAQGYDGGGPYNELMSRMVQWLVKNPAMEEEALRMTTQENGDLVIERQTMSDVTSAITVTSPSGKQIEIMPEEAGEGLWRAKITPDEYGLYRAEQKGERNLVAHNSFGPSNPEEYRNAVSTLDILKPAVEETGGVITRIADKQGNVSVPEIALRESGETMNSGGTMGVRMSEASVLKGLDKISLAPALLLLLLGTVAATYHVEGGGSLFRRKKKNAPSAKADAAPKRGM